MTCRDIVAEVAIADDFEEHQHLSVFYTGMNVIVGIKTSEGI
jgi:hypothetical protein